MTRPYFYCTYCTDEQLVPLLVLIESLNEQHDGLWTIAVYTNSATTKRLLEQARQPGLSCILVNDSWSQQDCSSMALMDQRAKHPESGVTYVAPELYFFEAPWQVEPTNNQIWRSGAGVRYWSIQRLNNLDAAPDEVVSQQWLSATRLPVRPLEETASGGLIGSHGLIQAVDFGELNRLSPGTMVLPRGNEIPSNTLCAIALRYIIQIQRAWIWVLGTEPEFQYVDDTQPPQGNSAFFAHGQDDEAVAKAFGKPGIPLQQGWHLHLRDRPVEPPVGTTTSWRYPVSRTYPDHFESSQRGSVTVSALISTYNAAAFLEGCLQNLVAQSLFQADQLEIIVLDSASEEPEREIAETFTKQHPNIRYLRTEHREGIYRAWNRAISIARGRYLTNANTDDRHHPQALETMANHLDGHPHVGLVYAQTYVTEAPHQNWDSKTPVDLILTPTPTPSIMAQVNVVGPQPMWRRALHQEVGYFDHRYRVAGDFEMWMRFAEVTQFAQLNEPLGLYLRRPDGVEHSNPQRCIHETRAIVWNWRHWRPPQPAP